jgi:hypothetical protein
MRDMWFQFINESTYGSTCNEMTVWSLDYDGCSDVMRTRMPAPDAPEYGGKWPRVKEASRLPLARPNADRLREFWQVMTNVSVHGPPALVMSGSARVVYQFPGEFEQDGLSHVAMQNEGLRMRGYSMSVDTPSLHLNYNFTRIAGLDTYTTTARAKMDIVLQQINYAKSLKKKKKIQVEQIRFVFVDDIYAPVLAEMFRQRPSLVPKNVTIHLVEYVSYRERRRNLKYSIQIVPSVMFYPF